MSEKTDTFFLTRWRDALYNRKGNYFLYILIAFVLYVFLGNSLSKIELQKTDRAVGITARIKIKKDDRFHLFYMPEGFFQHRDENMKVVKAYAQERFQDIQFSLPDTVRIKELRLDLGTRLDQGEIEIQSIFLKYNDEKVVLFNAEDSVNFFVANECVSLGNKKNFFLASAEGIGYDPYIFTKDISDKYSALLSVKNRIPFPYLISFLFSLSLLVYFVRYAQPKGFMPSFYTFASCFFVLLLLMPFLNEVFEFYHLESQEKRVLQKKPAFNAKEMENFPAKFESYYGDNFGFRELLIKIGGKLLYKVFHASANPKVAVGIDGWLFLDGRFYKITEDLLKENLFSELQLKKAVAEWETRKFDLQASGIKYYKAIWPDKHYIYPECLPFAMRAINKDTITRGEQAINYLSKKSSHLKVIDVRPALLQAKSNTQVYEKYDSHWNSYGAFIAYSELMKVLSKDFEVLQPHTLHDFQVTWQMDPAGDLGQLLGLDLLENKPHFDLKRDSSVTKYLHAEDLPYKTIILENAKSSTSLTVLIHGDSFTGALLPFLQTHFKKIVLVSDVPYSRALVNQVHPDLVIEGYATRYFR